MFWSDGAVLFFDVHQHPWYPGTGSPDENGEGKGRGLIVNNPFPAGSGRKEILGVFREALVPAADRFEPQLVMISAGFDSRAGDPLGRFMLTDQDFAELTGIAIGIARQHAGGRVVSVLEGGYSLDGLPRAVASHLENVAFVAAALVLVALTDHGATRWRRIGIVAGVAVAVTAVVFVVAAGIATGWSAADMGRWIAHPGIGGPGDRSTAVGWGVGGLFHAIAADQRAFAAAILLVVVVRLVMLAARSGTGRVLAAAVVVNAGAAFILSSW